MTDPATAAAAPATVEVVVVVEVVAEQNGKKNIYGYSRLTTIATRVNVIIAIQRRRNPTEQTRYATLCDIYKLIYTHSFILLTAV